MILLLKLTPVVLLSVLMLLSSLEILALDILVIAPIATLYAGIIAHLVDKISFHDLLDVAVDNVREMIEVFFILMLATALAESFMSTGVGAAVINVALNLGISARTIAPIALIVSAVLSIATGSSWGTFAATIPIFLWLNHMIGGSVPLVMGAVVGGSCFGDNLGLISDTTVVSSGVHGVNVVDRSKYQGVWSLLVLFIGATIFLFVSRDLPGVQGSAQEAIDAITPEAWEALAIRRPTAVDLLDQVGAGVPYYMITPLLVIIVTAIMGFPTLACLSLGLVASLVLGLMAGTTTVMYFLTDIVEVGFAGAGSWVIVMMMWVGAFGGIMNKMDAFMPLKNLITSKAKSVRELMLFNGLLSIVGNGMLADEMAQIITIGPIINEITEENVEGSQEDIYRLKLRNATFSSALGVYGSMLFPWHVYIIYFLGISQSVYPLYEFGVVDILANNFVAWLAVGSLLLFTITDLDKLIPLFRLPTEPNVVLKDKKS